MRFLIRTFSGSLPDLPLGPRGRELGCYLPADIEWRQVNYGQGEGQVEVAGREWGFYQDGTGALAVVLHVGQLDSAEGLAFIRRVAEVVAGGTEVEVLLQGTEAE
jgi:hypothetical protein